MKPFLLYLLITAIACSCSQKKIVHPQDYNAYLNPVYLSKAVEKQKEEIAFWSNHLQ